MFAPFPHLIAQAGGGGGYGGGGGGGGGGYSGGGGSGGGSGGGGEAIVALVRLTILYPHVMIPLWIVVAVVFYYGKREEKTARVRRTIRRGRKVQEQDRRSDALQAVRQRDPGFTVELFLDRVSHAFLTTQYAWSEQNLSTCRAFLSDGVHERFELYIGMQKAEGLRNRMKDVTVESAKIVSVESAPHFDTIHVRIAAAAITYNESLTTGKRVSGRSDRTRTPFTEVWSFSRRPGVKTSADRSILEGRCPNCGGPVAIVDRAECPQCGSIVNSGQYDWVLAEITQDEEWVVPAAAAAVPGWDELRRTDPHLNVQQIEDRASVIFWRAMMAEYHDDFALAAPVVQRGADAIPRRWRQGENRFWKTPAVGVVELVRCLPAGGAGPDDGFERLRVMVRWSATPASGDRRDPRLHGPQRIRTDEMILKRKRGTVSAVDRAFSSANCQTCGAPIDASRRDACSFCGAPLNDGSNGWVLEDVVAYQPLVHEALRSSIDDAPPRLAAESLSNHAELLTAMARMLWADGSLHERERQDLLAFARHHGISEERAERLLEGARDAEPALALPNDPAEAKQMMDALVRAALIDGRLDRRELRLLEQVAARAGWTAADLKLAVRRQEAKLYRQARQVIRDDRRSKRGPRRGSTRGPI
ncbi:TIM44-like domain-containing protein [Alienimonas californiensis]|uniref:Dna-J like membrane chaperone protein n=1 Tax=Alienimonas californiensis TaxID=2527989 RepID=A0A517P7W4_9PLAN|nr:TIM44-like domain-containing protein [Alienimonas californiensis]QDT15435.1 Dna-J like membrane chaperone protein [Alienimonas californiensis]